MRCARGRRARRIGQACTVVAHVVALRSNRLTRAASAGRRSVFRQRRSTAWRICSPRRNRRNGCPPRRRLRPRAAPSTTTSSPRTTRRCASSIVRASGERAASVTRVRSRGAGGGAALRTSSSAGIAARVATGTSPLVLAAGSSVATKRSPELPTPDDEHSPTPFARARRRVRRDRHASAACKALHFDATTTEGDDLYAKLVTMVVTGSRRASPSALRFEVENCGADRRRFQKAGDREDWKDVMPMRRRRRRDRQSRN